jgi:eukaryotic-like serine/threonine-protein kinase
MNERAIFMEALDRETLAERSAYLDEACGGDTALRQRVEALLTSHEQAGSFLGKPVPERLAEGQAAPDGPTETQGELPARDGERLDFLTPSDKPGSLGRLGHYEIQEVIGRGGMGIVLRAFDDKLHRVAAIKVMAPHMPANGAARKRFVREARAAAAVRDEHVVGIYAVEETAEAPYLAMEYIAGVSLQERLDRSGPLEVKEILRIGLQAASGLAAAHAQGLIHRDVKPANILLENHVERVKITDFGLARAVDDASLTQEGVVAGTPQYMAPEQARGEALDHRADLFSLGSVLYALCTGHPPFRAENTLAVLKRVCEDTPRPIREINPDVPEWLVEIIAQLQAKDPAERYQTAREVVEVLGQELAAVQRGDLKRPPTPHSAPPAKRSRRGVVVAAAMLLLFAAGFVLMESTGITHLTATALGRLTPSTPPAAKGEEGRNDVQPAEPPTPSDLANSIGMKLKLIKPGKFLMGSPKEEAAGRFDNEGPQHEVEITKAFYMGACPVTKGQFAAFVKDDGYQTDAEKDGKGGESLNLATVQWEQKPENTWRHPGFSQGDDHPVVDVSWNDATAFCAWLSKKEGKTYELPTEAEWEYACRAGTTTRFWCGDVDASLQGNANVADASLKAKSPGFPAGTVAWDDGYMFTSPAGSFKANPWGLYDMHGNVWQWCADGYGPYQDGYIKDPNSNERPNRRVARGGSWWDRPRGCWSAYRGCFSPVMRNGVLGVRVVLRLPARTP